MAVIVRGQGAPRGNDIVGIITYNHRLRSEQLEKLRSASEQFLLCVS
jgi:hypothetical protein